MKKTVLLSFLVGLLFGSASEVLACGSCVYILFDRFLPPIMGWVALSVIWSFSLSIYSAITGIEIWGANRPISWLILVSILYEKNYGNDDDEKIESALSKLTGLTLPEGSPPEEWKRNWNLKADRGPYYSKSSH